MNHETILIVEDDSDLNEKMRDLLEGVGYAVLDAASAAEAAEISNGLKSPIHLLVVDAVLPDFSGAELADCLRETRPGLPVLYLNRPFAVGELERSVRLALDRQKPKRILLVDDDSQVLTFASEVLREAGYEVMLAEDGNVALAIVETEPLNLVITDLVMREREGLETMMQLRTSHPELPVVVISGAFNGHFLRNASMMGARATLAKPFSGEDLLATVQTVLGR